ncbi:putative zinc finger in N-recognin-domain-containing protein [Limtongia smithiae]|uniref:putative zinc finger in N-recognin-domain-containing protein n=1 Tax=Limtongia smithiae TaxID=1125753 RepID=UPI0034CEA291
MPTSQSSGSPASITALDYIESQEKLEHDAREVLPYDPTHCTYHDGPLRQPVYACLTCVAKTFGTKAAGVCYSCSIQCHSDHDLVELFNKRNFTCDCGTTRMRASGGCNLRKNFTKLDTASSTNRYDHNFEGRFCACDSKYNPATEQGTMYQCLLGDACNEDWYHEECILGLPFPPPEKAPVPKMPPSPKGHPTGTDLLHSTDSHSPEAALPPAPNGHPTKVKIGIVDTEQSSTTDEQAKPEPKSPHGHPTGVKLYPLDVNGFELGGTPVKKKEPPSPKGHPTGVNLLQTLTEDMPASAHAAETGDGSDGEDEDEEEDDEGNHVPPPGFPDDNLFEAFICWKCVTKHRFFLGRWAGWKDVALDAVVRIQPEDESEGLVSTFKRKLEDAEEEASEGRASKRIEVKVGTSTSNSTPSLLPRIDEDKETSQCQMPTECLQAVDFSLFLVDGWREKICRCPSCLVFLDMFPVLKDEEITYEPPPDNDDDSTCSFCLLCYTSTNRFADESLVDAGTRALNSLPRVNAMEGIYAYNRVKSKLETFLRPFAEEGRIVSEQDVKVFFDKIKSEQQQRR